MKNPKDKPLDKQLASRHVSHFQLTLLLAQNITTSIMLNQLLLQKRQPLHQQLQQKCQLNNFIFSPLR